MAKEIDQRINEPPFSDLGNSEALAALYGDKLRYVHGEGRHIWKESYWQPDAVQETRMFVDQLARERQRIAVSYNNDKTERQERVKQAFGLENRYKSWACLDHAQHMEPFSTPPSALDRDLMLLACSNG